MARSPKRSAPPSLNQLPRPIPAKASIRGRVELPDYLPARMLNEFVYCPRLFFYEWVDGVFAHSADTVSGTLRHEKLERKADALPPASELASERIHSRSVTLSSEAHRVIATLDLVEGNNGVVSPVDYKHGRPRDGDDGLKAWPTDRAQVCLQAIILREHGFRCDEGIVYYNATKQRVRVVIDEGAVGETLAALASAREVAAAGVIPPPLADSPNCPRCSLVGICLPDETRDLRRAPGPDAEQLSLFDEPAVISASAESRRLIPARDDLRPLYVIGQGLSVGKSGGVLQVKDVREARKVVQEARLNDVSQVNLFGNVQVSTQALQALCEEEKPIAYFSQGGWFYGFTQGLGLKNVFLRQAQFGHANDSGFAVVIARSLVASKIRNQRTLIQRNHEEPSAVVLDRLKRLARQAERCWDLESLRGLEGTAARLYFEHFAGMLKVDTEEGGRPAFHFEHRNRRPPRDPVNALLSLVYSLLAKDLTIVCTAIGFDPFMGFYHQPRFGRPALALDLMEPFRPLIADSAVLSTINTRMVTTGDFITVGESVALTGNGRKAVMRAYEQRMDQLVTHPRFGYRVSYRRVLEIQARLLARVVAGEARSYDGFETR